MAFEYTHGGDYLTLREKYGEDILDFSASVSPFGLDPEVKKACEKALATADLYPDPMCRKLRKALGAKEGISPSRIVCGNGAEELIWRLAHALPKGKTLIPVPMYTEYARALADNGWEVSEYCLSEKNNFSLTEDILKNITPELSLLVLCEPGNPTGRVTDLRLLTRILRKTWELGIFCLVDNCFGDFLPEDKGDKLSELLKTYPNVFCLRAFTKFHAMAGLRLGWLICGTEAAADRIFERGPLWSVSHVAQAAGICALSREGKAQREYLIAQREILEGELISLGLKVIPGEANFLLFKGPEDLAQRLLEKHIAIRDCSNFAGLSFGWFRIGVRTGEENRVLIDSLKAVMRDEYEKQ